MIQFTVIFIPGLEDAIKHDRASNWDEKEEHAKELEDEKRGEGGGERRR